MEMCAVRTITKGSHLTNVFPIKETGKRVRTAF